MSHAWKTAEKGTEKEPFWLKLKSRDLGELLSLGHLSDNWGKNVLFKLFQNLFYLKAPCFQEPLASCVCVSCEGGGGGAGFCRCCSIMRTACWKWRQPQIPISKGSWAAFLGVYSVTTHTFCVAVYSNSDRAAGLQVWLIIWGFFLFVFWRKRCLLETCCVLNLPSSEELVAPSLTLGFELPTVPLSQSRFSLPHLNKKRFNSKTLLEILVCHSPEELLYLGQQEARPCAVCFKDNLFGDWLLWNPQLQ